MKGLGFGQMGLRLQRPSRGAAGPSYDSLVAADFVLPAFTPLRTIVCTNSTQLNAAVSGLLAGDLVDCRVVGGWDYSGQFFNTAKALASEARFLFGTGADAVRFQNPTTANLPACFVNSGSSNLTFIGGKFSTPNGGGNGILCYGSTNVKFLDFVALNCGNHGIAMFTVGAPVNGNWIKGEAYNIAQNKAIDTHAEKGTGQHACILADSGSGNLFSNVKVAMYGHDFAGGAVVEIGGDPVSNVEIWAKGLNLTMAAVQQVGGNCFQYWGSNVPTNLRVHWVEATNAQGRVVEMSGCNAGLNLAGLTVEHGRHSNTNQNQAGMGSAGLVDKTNPYDASRPTIVYQDCL